MADDALGFDKRAVAAGTVIFQDGDPGEAMYVIEHGRVSLSRTRFGRHEHLATLSDGAVFGEMAAIDGAPHSSRAEALDDTVLLRVSAGVLAEKLKRADPFVRHLLTLTIAALREADRHFTQRPRSLRDFVNAMADHSGYVRDYINAAGLDEISTDVLRDLEQLETLLKRLRGGIGDLPERRRDVLPDRTAP